MSIQAGLDYAFARKMSWLFATGVGPGSAVVTRNLVALIPHRTVGGSGRTMTTTTFQIGGQPVAEALSGIVADPETSPESLEEVLHQVAKDLPRGPVLEKLADFKRIMIRTGWFGRGVSFSPREKGLIGWVGFWTLNIRPAKDELEQFRRFFQNDPRLLR